MTTKVNALHSPRQPRDGLFWVKHQGDWRIMDAAEVLVGLEEGAFELTTMVRLNEEARSKPLRKYLRELVWMSYMDADEVGAESAARGGPFQVAFAHSHAGVVIADLSGRIQRANHAFAELIGRVPLDLEGVLVRDISQHDDHDREVKLGNEMFAGKRTGYRIEKRFQHRDGNWVPTLMHLALVRDDLGRPQMVVASVIGMAERLALEERRALEVQHVAMQVMARGVAHDFNNLLQVVQSSVAFIRMDYQLEENEDLRAIKQAAEMAGRLTAQLQQLARVGASDHARCDLTAELNQRRALLQQLSAQSGQKISVTVPERPVHVSIDKTALEQVLLNLVVNACQATPSDGRIHISLAERDGTAELVVADTGCGMTSEVKARALEPFFTARPGGTGLGLAIVNTAVTRCGCSLDIESEQGVGTRMRVTIPGANDH
jgi:two-component system, cell cycle sensor histidine kinase and response regulator CckA